MGFAEAVVRGQACPRPWPIMSHETHRPYTHPMYSMYVRTYIPCVARTLQIAPRGYKWAPDISSYIIF